MGYTSYNYIHIYKTRPVIKKDALQMSFYYQANQIGFCTLEMDIHFCEDLIKSGYTNLSKNYPNPSEDYRPGDFIKNLMSEYPSKYTLEAEFTKWSKDFPEFYFVYERWGDEDLEYQIYKNGKMTASSQA